MHMGKSSMLNTDEDARYDRMIESVERIVELCRKTIDQTLPDGELNLRSRKQRIGAHW